MTDQQLLDDLLELERAGWRALCEYTGDRFYGDLMTDDALTVLANGAAMDRDAVTAALGQAPPWRSFELSGHGAVRQAVPVDRFIPKVHTFCFATDPKTADRLLFDGDGLGQVARLVDVVAAGAGHRGGEHLQRNRRQQRLEKC